MDSTRKWWGPSSASMTWYAGASSGPRAESRAEGIFPKTVSVRAQPHSGSDTAAVAQASGADTTETVELDEPESVILQEVFAQFFCDTRQILGIQLSHVRRDGNFFQQWKFFCAHILTTGRGRLRMQPAIQACPFCRAGV